MAEAIHVGSERQLLFDDFFFEENTRLGLVLHRPTIREVVLRRDRPWEGEGLHYSCVLKDEDRYRMWYRADEGARQWTCYAESPDGVHWKKPNLGLVTWRGSTANNIVFPMGEHGGANPSVIIDPNARGPEDRYKMILRGGRIDGFSSPDGLHWEHTGVILDRGPVDSHNVLMWDNERREYVVFARDLPEQVGRRRSIRRGSSRDFRKWSGFKTIIMPDQVDPPDLNLYTNAAAKYFRAAHAYFMFPMILYTGRVNPSAPHPGLSDVQFISSRDGVEWSRNFREPFLTPGLDERNWVDRNPIMGVGIVPTGEEEISMYYSELLRSPETRFRRATLRTDGFVSVSGPYEGWGEFTTRPLSFSGTGLELNYSTSGGGSILVEIQGEDGRALPGHGLEDCVEVIGDRVAGRVQWRGGDGFPDPMDGPIRIRVRMRDAHLYSFRFVP